MEWTKSNHETESYFQLPATQKYDDDGQLTPLPLGHHDSHDSGSFFSRIKQSISGSSLGNILGQRNRLPRSRRVSQDSGFLFDANVRKASDSSVELSPVQCSAIDQVSIPSKYVSLSFSGTISSTSPDMASISSITVSTTNDRLPYTSHKALAESIADIHLDRKLAAFVSTSETQSTPPLTPDLLAEIPSPTTSSTLSRSSSRQSTSLNNLDEENTAFGAKDLEKGKEPAIIFVSSTGKLHSASLYPNAEVIINHFISRSIAR